VVFESDARPDPTPDRCRLALARTRRADRVGPGYQDHWGRGIRSRPEAGHRRKAFTADAARLLAIGRERNAVGFVLGLPINMDASEGPRAQSTRAFARNFSRLTHCAIALWDERLSTAAVERELIGMDMSRARRARVIDEHAAIFILQGALDRLSRLSEKR
jgi:putative transcription antitermination factor YqgF